MTQAEEISLLNKIIYSVEKSLSNQNGTVTDSYNVAFKVKDTLRRGWVGLVTCRSKQGESIRFRSDPCSNIRVKGKFVVITKVNSHTYVIDGTLINGKVIPFKTYTEGIKQINSALQIETVEVIKIDMNCADSR
jgi:hypothetical protein